MSNFATWCKQTREALGYSQGEMARVLGVSVPAVSRWERGSRVPGRITREAIGRFFAEGMAGAGANCAGPRDGLGGKSSTAEGV